VNYRITVLTLAPGLRGRLTQPRLSRCSSPRRVEVLVPAVAPCSLSIPVTGSCLPYLSMIRVVTACVRMTPRSRILSASLRVATHGEEHHVELDTGLTVVRVSCRAASPSLRSTMLGRLGRTSVHLGLAEEATRKTKGKKLSSPEKPRERGLLADRDTLTFLPDIAREPKANCLRLAITQRRKGKLDLLELRKTHGGTPADKASSAGSLTIATRASDQWR